MSCYDEPVATRAADSLRLMGVERLGAMGSGAEGAVNGAAADEPPCKRLKVAALDDAAQLRKRVLDYKLLRLKTLRDRFTEQLSELYFLQAGGNMMDYVSWHKRPAAPQLTAFLEARRPPAVAPPPPEPPPARDEVGELARQEAGVARRVAELARAGLWPERRLPRVLEPPRHKTHWDYLLEEMAWLAQDFAHERKWKKQAAKKCARAVQKYFQDKAAAAQKAEKAQELQLKKIAAFAAKEIRTFWSNVEKLVEWKRVRRVERARKEALDSQLSYIVDRTERYSRQLAATLAPDTPPDEPAPRRPSADYAPADDSADDEDTIAEQERLERAEDTRAELAALRDEADLDLADLVRRYQAAPPTPSDRSASPSSGSDSDSSAASGGRLEALVGAVGAAAAGAGEEARVEAAAELAASLQPTGTTLSETSTTTPVPRLLRHTLREYQHVGLHWLATMHARQLNGILADEMGLGKTIQTIALLAHLALELHDWGPHLVVAPTSVVFNWEMEFKKWCPSFKILNYYGTIKERKLKRVGWTKANSFHVCITSYKLVVQDHQSFRRKRWKYLILDEAQNIKNFKSQRWQMLLNFQTERRLLLTGTPLQNSLLELWSLMHFLMPDVFASHTEFKEWFTGVAGIADGSQRYSEPLVRRLHAVLRPFLLRRLKADVERQLPRKYEHVLLCRLAKRQRFLYDDFMSRAKTKESLASGNLLSVINVLMQLRKVCNHPDLFEARPVQSPLQLAPLLWVAPALALRCGVAERAQLAARLGGSLAALEAGGARAFPAHRARHLAPPRPARAPPPAPPRAPPAALRLHLRLVPRAPPPDAPRAPSTPALPPAPAAAPAPAPAAPARPPAARLAARRRECLRRVVASNERRCWRLPLYGADLREAVSAPPPAPPPCLAPPDLQQLLRTMHDTIDRFSVCWERARAGGARAGVGRGAGAWRAAAARAERAGAAAARPLLALLHAPASRQAVAFPHPRLLQYDCGKLQTLDGLLRRLKAGAHRVLIFTQMTRVLDVLEAFLSLHGHAYLRLDGATRVEARQPLVDRFNNDARVFAFILSTRSGGVGLNLTGADSVVFYDSDWNPTMDAQAQDRCHRIGQTRDVHVFRLVTAGTVEENILRKADQKRRLGQLAIETGNFTTSYLRAANISELFGAGVSPPAADEADTAAALAAAEDEADAAAALAAAEDEADAAAARAAGAEASRDLAEFDETLPLDDEPAPDPDADDLAALMNQLTPIEKYAMRVVESSEESASAAAAALLAARQQQRDWERARRELAAAEEPRAPAEPAEPAAEPAEPALTYSREDARAQVWVSSVGDGERMPMWCPPTPPSSDGDVYVEPWSLVLYRAGAAAEALLPAARRERPPRARARAPRAAPAPPSLFERAPGRPRPRPRAAPPRAPPAAPAWAGAEDAALRRALRLQRLAAPPPPARQPNWDWAAELVHEAARAFRSARACRDRHDALADPERARRKNKKPAARRRADDDAPRPPLARLDAHRDAAERRRAAPKRRLDDHHLNNPKHAQLLADHGVDYDAPPTPMEIASRRAERIAKEKQKAGGAGQATAAPPAATAAPAPGPAPSSTPQRIVVAATGPRTETPRRPRPAAPSTAPTTAPATPHLLYRHPAIAARHHLKILHHTTTTHSQVGPGEAALRTLQLQQLALRRAAPPAAAPRLLRHPAHVVVAHLAPADPAPSAAPAPAAPAASAAPPAPDNNTYHQ